MNVKRALRAIAVLLIGCRSAGTGGSPVVASGVQPLSGGRVATPPLALEREVNPADVNFMSGMIPHHAQAVLIAGWAASHGASPELQALCARIVVAQRDEIELMRNWLRDRGQPVPAPDARRHRMVMHGMEHEMLMPGMLTDEELARLDNARGPHFDELFLEFMIKHHEGALQMVEELFSSHGAAQDETVFRLASDIYADQTAEIERMRKMLASVRARRSGD
jgi:uncharacterized protein (DUF305 family)